MSNRIKLSYHAASFLIRASARNTVLTMKSKGKERGKRWVKTCP